MLGLPPRAAAQDELLPAVLDTGQPGRDRARQRAGPVPTAPSATISCSSPGCTASASRACGLASRVGAACGPARNRHRWSRFRRGVNPGSSTPPGTSPGSTGACTPTSPTPGCSEGHRIAADLGERRGWTRGIRHEVDRALVVALSTHATGDQVRYSELFRALRARRLSVERTVEVLDLLGVLDDDRTPAVDLWLDRNLADVSAGIRHDVEAWLRMLRDGGPRSRPRAPQTVWTCLNAAQPVLVEWSARYQHLREVTRDDILAVAAARHGNDRHYTLSVLRSLFRHCTKTGTIFRDPAARVPVGRHDYSLALPLPAEQLQAVAAAAVTPVVRVAIALAAIHAARPNAIRRLHVDDIDLGNRRLTVAGRSRPLDDLTRHVLLDWLDYRRARWPDTANPHVLITQQTANETGPVSPAWMARTFGGLGSTLEQLRVDRQLDEALTRGPDPLHLAAVFDIDAKTAVRYANNARQLLTTGSET